MMRGLHRFLGVLVILSMLLAVLPASALANPPYPDEPAASPSVVKLPQVAIGSTGPVSKHERAPREDLVQQWVKGTEGFPKNATAEQIQAAVNDYYAKFYKRSGDWTNPKVQAMVPERENQLAGGGTGTASVNAIQPITATVLSLSVQFSATESISMTCLTAPEVITGPLQGQMAHPAALDNNTIWYSATQTANPKFYEDLAFGYQGIGRVRLDLTDPTDGLPGINLAGYTVQDYYDHVAGDGNVAITGTFQGWVTVPHSEGYYGAPKYDSDCKLSDNDGGKAPVGQVAVDAVTVFSTTHSSYYTDTSATAFWPRFDANGDGVVDAFWVVHAGAGQESGGGAQGDYAIWSHSWALSAQSSAWAYGFKVYEGDPLTTTDDIYIDPYTVQPENLDLGVLVEEFGHNFFGLPDLYTTDAQNSTGFWTEMGAGSWGGWLGGSVPVGMPLWFRMMAWCNVGYCNWQEPMVIREHNAPAADIVIGQLEKTPAGISKGVRVNLPSIPEAIPNRAGTGNAAWSGTGVDSASWTLDRQIAIGASATGVLSFTSYWDLEKDYDYAYVMVNGTALSDTTSFMGTGILGPALNNKSTTAKTLSFNLAAYKGMTVTLRLRYVTDSGVTWGGWWIDNLMLDGAVIDNFTGASAPSTFPGWVNSGFSVVPVNKLHANYYLVEWRADTKYDKMVRTAYVTTDSGPDLWRVERVPYNVPAALLYYRNEKYPNGYSQRGYYADSPSLGPKNKLLVVDMNAGPMRLGTTPATYKGYLNSRASSYDAGLTLQATAGFTISKVYGAPPINGPFYFPPKPAVKGFNDVLGYYAGFYAGSPCPAGYVCYANRDGSAVIPARDKYSVRTTTFSGSPYYDYYGSGFSPSWLGSGNPGDDAAQYGVIIGLEAKASDNTTATLSFKNQSVDFITSGDGEVTVAKDWTYTVTYQTVMENVGLTAAHNVGLAYTLDSALTIASVSVDGSSAPLSAAFNNPASSGPVRWSTGTLNPGDMVTVTVVANGNALGPGATNWLLTTMDGTDGIAPRQQIVWTYVPFYKTYLPIVVR